VYCVSIALEYGEKSSWGWSMTPPGKSSSSPKREGARLNGRRLTVSKTSRLSKSLLATGFPYDLRESPVNNFDHFRNFALRTHAVRRCGSAALDLCYVAAGRFDGFWEMNWVPGTWPRGA